MARRTKTEAEQTRHRLLDAAELLFQEHGVSHTSLGDIAAAAGTTRGAIYWHFRDKADLFNAMIDRISLPLEQALLEASEQNEGDCTPLGNIYQALLAALHTTVHDPQTRRVFEIAIHKIEHVGPLRAVADRHLQVLRSIMAATEAAMQATVEQTGQSLPVPVPVAAMGLHMLLDGLIKNWLIDPTAFDLEVMGQLTMQTYLRGLGLKRPEPAA